MGVLKHGELHKGPCKKYVHKYVREIWKRDERYGKREMRDMKRYEWNMKERSFYR